MTTIARLTDGSASSASRTGARLVSPPSARSVPSTSTGRNAPGTAVAAMRASTLTVRLSKRRVSRRTRSDVVTSNRTDEAATSLGASPPRTSVAATPASQAPFAPPPDRTRVVGASRAAEGAHAARTRGGRARAPITIKTSSAFVRERRGCLTDASFDRPTGVASGDRASRDAREIDEAPLDVRAHELDAHPVGDVEPLDAPHDLAVHRRREHPHPRSLVAGTRDDRVESLADAGGEQQRRRRLPHLALDLGGVVLRLGRVASQRGELRVGVRRRLPGERCLEE